MKGSVLGISEESGVIVADGGERYGFAFEEWKGEGPLPRVGQTVDFDVRGDAAVQIYPIPAAGNRFGDAVKDGVSKLERSLNEEKTGEAAGKARRVIAERPQVTLAVVMLIASFALTWLSMGGILQSQRIEASLFSVPGIVADVSGPLEDTVATMTNYLAEAQDSSFTPPAALAKARANLNQASAALWVLRFAWLVYLIPVGAVAILVLEYRGTRIRLVELATGALAVLTLLAVLFGREMLAAAVTNNFGTGGGTLRTLIQVGFGGWLIAACGVGLILTALGIVRRTPGL